MMSEKVSDVWKWISGILAGMMVAGVPGMAAYFKDTVTHSEMKQYIKEDTPYVGDKKIIFDNMLKMKNEGNMMAERLSLLREDIHKVVRAIDLLVDRMDHDRKQRKALPETGLQNDRVLDDTDRVTGRASCNVRGCECPRCDKSSGRVGGCRCGCNDDRLKRKAGP